MCVLAALEMFFFLKFLGCEKPPNFKSRVQPNLLYLTQCLWCKEGNKDKVKTKAKTR